MQPVMLHMLVEIAIRDRSHNSVGAVRQHWECEGKMGLESLTSLHHHGLEVCERQGIFAKQILP